MDVYAGEFLRFTDEAARAVGEKLQGTGAAVAYDLQEAAKREAPWKDRTGRARRSITGSYDVKNGILTVCLAGMMPYSPELEVGYEGRYSILLPTVYYRAADAVIGAIGGLA